MLNEGIIRVLVLSSLYLVYMLLGALIFMEIERENEKSLFLHFNKLFQEFNSTRNVSDALMKDLSKLYREAFSVGISDPFNSNYRSKWDFAGSFYFVGTVLTTIGFGLTAPITLPGQVCFLFYALLGIPLNILLFNTLLDQTVNIFTSILTRINQCWKKRRTLGNQNNHGEPWEATTVTIAVTCFVVVIVVILLAAPMFVFLEDWSYFESIYFLVVSFTTVGFGDFVPGGLHTSSGDNLTPHYRVGNWFVIILGTIFMYTAMALMASMYKQCLENLLEKSRKCFKKKKSNRITASPSAPSTPAQERSQSIASPLRDERKRQMAARALQNWRAAKKPNIGLVNQVEESILKTRRVTNTDDRPGLDAFQFLPLADLSRRPSVQTIKAQTNFDDLTTLEAKLTKEFNHLLKEIEQQRENLLKKQTINEERGIRNGAVIAGSSSESTASPPPPLCSDDAGSRSTTVLSLNMTEPQQQLI